MGPDIIVFSPFFCFSEKCDNSKHTNLIFFHRERQRTRMLKPFLSFLVIFGTCRVKPVAFADKRSEGRTFAATPLRGNETLLSWFTVLDVTRQSTGREGRVKGSKVTVFNSEGFHATVARTTSTTAGRGASCCSSPYCFRRFFFFYYSGAHHSFDH